MSTKPTLLYAITAVLLLPLAAAAQDSQTWKKLSPAGDIFSVTMPTPVSEKTVTNPDDSNMTMRAFSSEEGRMFYYVAALDVARKFSPTPATFNSFVGGFLNSYCGPSRQQGLACETAYVREMTLNGYAAKQYKVKLSSGEKVAHGVIRLYMTHKKFYVIQTLGPQEGDASGVRFLDSFSLAGAKPASP